jgi:hypothetical protein
VSKAEAIKGFVPFTELSRAIATDSGMTPYALARNKLTLHGHSFPNDKVLGSFETTKAHTSVHDGIQYRYRLEQRKPGTARFQPDSTPEERRTAMEAIMIIGRADRVNGEGFADVQDVEKPGTKGLIYVSLYRDGAVDYNGKPLTGKSMQRVVDLIESIPESPTSK